MLSRLFGRVAFDVHVFFPDGSAPESSLVRKRALSSKWLAICEDLYNNYGPIFRHNMGSTLSHFDVTMAGPIGELIVSDIKCFDLSVCDGSDSEQNAATIDHFSEKLVESIRLTGSELSAEATRALQKSRAVPSLLLFDYCREEVSDDLKMAIVELGYHLVAAYLRYCRLAV